MILSGTCGTADNLNVWPILSFNQNSRLDLARRITSLQWWQVKLLQRIVRTRDVHETRCLIRWHEQQYRQKHKDRTHRPDLRFRF